MGSYNLLCGKLGFSFEGVNVLGEAAEQKALLVEQAHEVVCRCGLVSAWKEFLHIPSLCEDAAGNPG